MTVFGAVLVGVAFVLLAATAGLVWWSARPRVVASRLRHRVVVTLKDGASFAGLLWEADQRVWVLRQAEALAAGDRNTDVPVDGEILLMIAEFAYVQKP